MPLCYLCWYQNYCWCMCYYLWFYPIQLSILGLLPVSLRYPPYFLTIHTPKLVVVCLLHVLLVSTTISSSITYISKKKDRTLCNKAMLCEEDHIFIKKIPRTFSFLLWVTSKKLMSYLWITWWSLAMNLLCDFIFHMSCVVTVAQNCKQKCNVA